MAECSKGHILLYFQPSLNYNLSLRSLFCLFLSGRLTLSLPKVTVVELAVHCQTLLQSQFKGTVDRCLFLTVIRGANLLFFISKCSGDIIISYLETQFSVQEWMLPKCL